MLDLKFVRDNPEVVRENLRNRNVNLNLDDLLDTYDRRNSLVGSIEELRAARNENARAMKQRLSDSERARLVEEGRQLKQRIAELEDDRNGIEATLDELSRRLPNLTHPSAPVGRDESANRELFVVGEPARFDFAARDHVEIGTALDLVDFETATRVSGTKFYYLRNEGVFLELALVRFALDTLVARGFTPMITPDIARVDILAGIGFNPRGPESNVYTIEHEDAALVGTAEITLGGYFAERTLPADELPIRVAGLSHCFRREAGAAGQFSKGLYRVHQFTKVEMFVVCLPEQSEAMHDELLAIERDIFTRLEIPFRAVDVCTGDLGGPAYRKFDLEAWMPGRGDAGDWGEITSASNCTDYQSRRLGTRFTRARDGRTERGYVHMLNGTAIAISRAIIAILELFQQADGSVRIPAALQPYTGFTTIEPAGDQ